MSEPAPGPCQVCGAAAHDFAAEKDGHRYWRCRGCGLVALHPPPAEAELAELYGDPDKALTRAYFSKIPSKLRRARSRARLIARRMRGRRGRFLDVGCSGGFMTEAAREQGFEAHGLDPDAASVAWARERWPDNRYYVGRLEGGAVPGDLLFDAAYCSEVLEHVADAGAFMAALSARLAPGALLYLTTPDVGHWRRPKNLLDWDVFTPPHHCLFFTAEALKRLLARHGLRQVERRPAFKPGLKVLARKEGEAA